MTPHNHREYVPGCYRCELGRDEARDAETDRDVPYDREVLTTVLVYHQRKDASSCGCGWAVLGASHAEHVADVYEQAALGKTTSPKDVDHD